MMVTMTPTGFWARCESCEFIGPDPSDFHTDALALHRAMHHLGRTIAEELHLPQLVIWLGRKLTKDSKV
jgi:hypothetical protein